MQQIDRDALAAPGVAARVERGEHRDRRVERRDDVRHGATPVFDGVPGGPVTRHQPGERLDERVVAGQGCTRALAEAADLAMDDAAVDGGDALVVEAEAPSVPGRKFETTTSARSQSRRASARSRSSLRSSTIERLLRLAAWW